jgi:hypothetical protein
MSRDADDEAWVQLATRIPRRLHHAVRLHCITSDRTLMHFVVEAIEEKLARAGRRTGRRRVNK